MNNSRKLVPILVVAVLGLALPLDGPKTLNGLLLEQLQEIPEAPIAIRIGNCVIEVLHVQNQAIKVARLQRLAVKAYS